MPSPSALTFLIIEDEAPLRELLRLRLELQGYRVLEARDGVEGIARAADPSVDFIICDVMMPGEDGFSVCQKVRQRGRRIPFLFLTAKNQVDATVMGLQMGADDYLVKPFDMRELQARIQTLLRRYGR